MKSIHRTWPGALVFALTATAAFGAISDVDIQVAPRMLDSSQPRAEGHRDVSAEHWHYLLTLENRRFQPLLGLEVHYMTFFTTAALGSKEAAQQQHQSGNFPLDVLQPHEKKVFTTSPVEPKKSHLVGRRHYVNGGRIKAEDALVGVWVRVYQGGQLMAEYANPSTLMKEQWQ